MKFAQKMMAFVLAGMLTGSVCFTSVAAAEISAERMEPLQASSANLSAIEAERQALYQNLAEQLEMQNALDKMDIFSFLVEDTIQQKYGAVASTTNKSWENISGAKYASLRVYAENGGWFKGYTSSTTAEAQFFTPDQTEDLYANRNKSQNTISQLLIEYGIEDFIQSYAKILKLALLCKQAHINSMWNSIDVGDDGMVVYSVYSNADASTTVVFWPWNAYPYMDASIFYLDTISQYDVF